MGSLKKHTGEKPVSSRGEVLWMSEFGSHASSARNSSYNNKHNRMDFEATAVKVGIVSESKNSQYFDNKSEKPFSKKKMKSIERDNRTL